MNTEMIAIDSLNPDPTVIERAANLLRTGRLVAFPTETVYGLGANALDPVAVRSIYDAKGRPSNNPIIVHTATQESAKALAVDWPEAAERLASRDWPGPLTLVVKKIADVPDAATAGGPTVALRIPSHPVALALIDAAGVPVAAPSANRSNNLSPTLAKHVFDDLQGRIPMILDGGATSGGLESTVVDVTCDPPLLLRPGLLTVSHLRNIIGEVKFAESITKKRETARSPGMMDRHYAPQTPMECWRTGGAERANELSDLGERVAFVTISNMGSLASQIVQVAMPQNAKEYATRLYAVLHLLDRQSIDRIIVELPPDNDEWRAVRDRLRRAAERLVEG